MKVTLRWIVAVCVVLCNRVVLCTALEPSLAEARPLVEMDISYEATCGEWASWLPPRTTPAVVMQVVSKEYADLQRNFIRLMELNSGFTRENLYLMCLDDASVPIFASLGIRCVPLGALKMRSHSDLWKTRVRVVSCLVADGHDVIMSDSDALWLGDPIEFIRLSSSSSVIASRGSFPRELGIEWGTTLCMGFIMFRATGAAMDIPRTPWNVSYWKQAMIKSRSTKQHSSWVLFGIKAVTCATDVARGLGRGLLPICLALMASRSRLSCFRTIRSRANASTRP